MSKTVVNLMGRKFGRCEVVAFAGVVNTQARWECLCDCGSRFITRGYSLTSGNTMSCGCLQAEARRNSNKTHGMSNTAEHNSWTNMKTRCFNKNSRSYKNYGGRGITVCDRWLDFDAFLEDMGTKPGPDYSLEREDVNGNYCPENCRWAPTIDQQNNRRNNSRIEINGIVKTKADWCRHSGISKSCLDKRIARGLSGDDLIRTTGRVDPSSLPASTLASSTSP